ncbi:MAG: hypothetical protein OXG74_05795 [Acidobacteria bacterium]|nr:hypothetical protein [Acidobacteriota bacterium]
MTRAPAGVLDSSSHRGVGDVAEVPSHEVVDLVDGRDRDVGGVVGGGWGDSAEFKELRCVVADFGSSFEPQVEHKEARGSASFEVRRLLAATSKG